MYEVIDTRTGQVMGTYQTRRRATSRADRLDLQYGAVRYIVRHADSKLYASRFPIVITFAEEGD